MDRSIELQLSEAIRLHENDEAIQLIEQGANINHQEDCLSVTPLQSAIASKNIFMMQYLIESGKVDYRIKDDHGRTAARHAAFFLADSQSGIVEFLEEQETQQHLQHGTTPVEPENNPEPGM